MASASELEGWFGPCRGYSGADAWEELEAASGPLPVEYKEFVAAYGPGVVGKFLSVLHPRSSTLSMFETIGRMAQLHQELVPEAIPYDAFPREGGMVQWAHTVEADACFLVPGTEGTWRIGVWLVVSRGVV